MERRRSLGCLFDLDCLKKRGFDLVGNAARIGL
jgi:hypothetical protein